VDPWFLVESAPDITSLISSARKVNDSQPHFVVDWMERKVGKLLGKRICALGLTYKPDVDDFRESPAIDVVNFLIAKGAEVKAYDPFTMREPLNGIHPTSNLSEVLENADIAVILVPHEEIRNLIPYDFSTYPKLKIIFDTVNVTGNSKWISPPMKIYKLGSNKPE
jgi:UDP-N-acetyl-D-mannosaminuronic acid dehydrogenase